MRDLMFNVSYEYTLDGRLASGNYQICEPTDLFIAIAADKYYGIQLEYAE